jgi:hypothetical protein
MATNHLILCYRFRLYARHGIYIVKTYTHEPERCGGVCRIVAEIALVLAVGIAGLGVAFVKWLWHWIDEIFGERLYP